MGLVSDKTLWSDKKMLKIRIIQNKIKIIELLLLLGCYMLSFEKDIMESKLRNILPQSKREATKLN